MNDESTVADEPANASKGDATPVVGTPGAVASQVLMPGLTPRVRVPRVRTLSMRHILPVLMAGLVLGVAGDVLLFVRLPGIGTLIFVALLGVLLLAVGRSNGWSLPGSRQGMFLVPTMIFAAGIAYRTSPWLLAMNVVCLMLALAFVAIRLPSGTMMLGGFMEYVGGVVRVAAYTLADALVRVVPDTRWGDATPQRLRPHTGSVMRGIVLAVIALLVFGGLLMSADAQFERIVRNVFAHPASAPDHIARTMLVAWFVIGFLHVVYVRKTGLVQQALPERRTGGVEAIIVLATLNALFAIFVVLQLENLFGGMHHVFATSHLTLAQYARRGFFQLMLVSALVMPLLALADYAAHSKRHKTWVHRMSWVMTGLVMVIMASALQRLWLYQKSFGITDLRLYSTAFVIWLFVAFILFAATVLTGRRGRFTSALLISGFAAVISLNVINPDALIAGIDMKRASENHVVGFDPYYVEGLSADATPTIIRELHAIPAAERSDIAGNLLNQSRAIKGDWRSWNFSRSSASAKIRQSHSYLTSSAR